MIGRTFGRYRIEESLGRGGMAEVFRAVDEKLQRSVAIKIILPTYASDAGFQERFLSEARAATALEHPNILGVHASGVQNGEPFLVMPLMEAGTLENRLEEGPVAFEEASTWIVQLAEAIDFAHEAGVLHGNIKASKILISSDGPLLLADFGLAKGEASSAAADRYSFGALAYQLVTGALPSSRENPLAVLQQHISAKATSPSQLSDDLPATIEAAFASILAEDPTDRPRSCGAAAAAMLGETPADAQTPELGTDLRTLGLTAGVLLALAIAIVIALLTSPRLRFAPFETADLPILARGTPQTALPVAPVKPLDPAPDPRLVINGLITSINGRWRQGRFDSAFFDDLAARVAAARGQMADNPDLELLDDWAAGGKALTAGDEPAAREYLGKILANPAFREWIPLLPARFVGHRQASAETFHPWRLSVFWGDPLDKGAGQLEELIAEHGENRNLLLGRAVITHLDGDHAAAAAMALELERQFTTGQTPLLIARFAGDQFLWSGEMDRAVEWYKKLGTNAPRAEIAAVLHSLSLEGGPSVLGQACEGGFRSACEPRGFRGLSK
ncbi:MAG: serine/threonine-protein kinase [Acidobacteriota bacterium]|nr:serine/threonine-protein kinase [Acidobacteriota bacterium]